MSFIDGVDIGNDCFEHIHPGNAGHPAPRDKRTIRRPACRSGDIPEDRGIGFASTNRSDAVPAIGWSVLANWCCKRSAAARACNALLGVSVRLVRDAN